MMCASRRAMLALVVESFYREGYVVSYDVFESLQRMQAISMDG